MNKEISSTLYSIADCYYRLDMYKSVTDTYREIRKTTGQVSSADYEIIANSYYMLGNYKRAKKYYIESYNSKSSAEKNEGNSEYFIGCCWMEMMEWENAVKYF